MVTVCIIIIPLVPSVHVQYFQAVQKGKQRANKSQMKMFNAAGFGMLTLTTKRVDGTFEPVGEEDMAAVVKSEEGFVAIITDADGYTKAQSKAVAREEAESIYRKLTTNDSMPPYPGASIQIWSETRPTIQV